MGVARRVFFLRHICFCFFVVLVEEVKVVMFTFCPPLFMFRQEGGGGEGCANFMHSRSRMTIGPHTPTTPD